MTTRYHGLAASLCVLAMATTAHAKITDMKQGQGGSVVQGSAGPGGRRGVGLEHCDKPMGAMAVVEPQDES